LNWFTDLFTKPATEPAPDLSTITGDLTAITAALVYMRPLGAELIAFEKAWKDHSVEEELLAGIPLIAMVVKVLSIAFPQIAIAADGISLMAFIAPILVELLLKTGQNLVSDGQGGFVTKDWINDPRHKLNADGTFANFW